MNNFKDLIAQQKTKELLIVEQLMRKYEKELVEKHNHGTIEFRIEDKYAENNFIIDKLKIYIKNHAELNNYLLKEIILDNEYHLDIIVNFDLNSPYDKFYNLKTKIILIIGIISNILTLIFLFIKSSNNTFHLMFLIVYFYILSLKINLNLKVVIGIFIFLFSLFRIISLYI